jgi:hypothetical protein
MVTTGWLTLSDQLIYGIGAMQFSQNPKWHFSVSV